MKVCIVSDFSGFPDEGMKNVAYQLLNCLNNTHEVHKYDLSKIRRLSEWKHLIAFSPKVIIYVPGPSILSFFILKVMKYMTGFKTKTVIFASHPKIGAFASIIVPYVEPNLILANSEKFKTVFTRLGCITELHPVCIDTDKFKPVDVEKKKILRDKYNIDGSKFIVLHVGSIKKGRNVLSLSALNSGDVQVVIVGSITPGTENNVLSKLKSDGCKVITEYTPDVQELYALSDCYIFPTPAENELNAITIPLSVLEAMSCNLPVVTTKFGGLPDIIKEENGLFFIESDKDIIDKVNIIMNGYEPKTRASIFKYSLELCCKKINNCLYKLEG